MQKILCVVKSIDLLSLNRPRTVQWNAARPDAPTVRERCVRNYLTYRGLRDARPVGQQAWVRCYEPLLAATTLRRGSNTLGLPSQ